MKQCMSVCRVINLDQIGVPPEWLPRFAGIEMKAIVVTANQLKKNSAKSPAINERGFPPAENLALSTGVLRMFSDGTDLEGE